MSPHDTRTAALALGAGLFFFWWLAKPDPLIPKEIKESIKKR